MKKCFLMLVMVMVFATYALATDYYKEAYYWCHTHGYTNVTKNMTSVMNLKPPGSNCGALAYIVSNFDSWKIPSPPSKADLDAQSPAGENYWKAQTATDKAKFDNVQIEIKAAFLVLREWINDCVPAEKQKTLQEYLAAITAKIEQLEK